MFELSVPWWELILRGVIVYFALLLLLRITGKRQIGQLSPFDLILLLLISEAVSNSLNAADESLVGGLIAAATLILLNYLVGVATFSNKRLEQTLEGRPQVLIHDGKVFEDVMNEARLTQQELHSAMRHQGYFEVKEVKLAILEPNGTVSIQGYEKK